MNLGYNPLKLVLGIPCKAGQHGQGTNKIGLFRNSFNRILEPGFQRHSGHGQVTFNPTVEVTLGGSQPGSVIAAGTMPQIVRTTTFSFNSQDDLPRSRTMSFDTGVLNMNAITLGTELFETNIVISTKLFGLLRRLESATPLSAQIKTVPRWKEQ